jgi:heme oxygenase
MAAREPAHPIEKRDLLHGDPPNRARIEAIAEKLASEGRWPEAIDYLEVTHDAKLLAKAESDAVVRGAAWLLQQVERISGKKCDPEQWQKLSDAAGRAERWRDAVRALALAGKTAEAEALRLEKCPDYEPFKPLGK